MPSLAKTLIREVALRTPYVNERLIEWEFRRRQQSFRGIYNTFAEATAAAPDGPLVGYDHKEVAHENQPALDGLHPADYPVLFWMAPIMPHVRRIFDLGGNLGIAYYVYRDYLTYRPDLDWTVCEVPATVEAGRELAAERHTSQLHFTAERADADDCDLYFTAGALQYIEEPFATTLERLSLRPRHIVLTRVPLWKGDRFVTLQNNGKWTVPYKVENLENFARGIEALGYDLIDHWRIGRTLQVLTSPDHFVENYHGMYFRLDESSRRA